MTIVSALLLFFYQLTSLELADLTVVSIFFKCYFSISQNFKLSVTPLVAFDEVFGFRRCILCYILRTYAVLISFNFYSWINKFQ